MPTDAPNAESSNIAANLQTAAVTAGRESNGGALAPTIWASTSFEIPPPAQCRRIGTTPRVSRFYARHGNPSVRAFEDAVARMGTGQMGVILAATDDTPVLADLLRRDARMI